MLTCKNLVIVNGEKDAFTAVQYDRLHLDFAADEKVESFGKNNKSKAILWDNVYEKDADGNVKSLCTPENKGKEWQGTRPATKVSGAKDIAPLIQDAVNQLVKEYGALADYKDIPEDSRGWLLLLTSSDYGRDLWVRAKIQADTRPAKAVDPAVALEGVLKSMIREAASNGKVLTMEAAKKRYDRIKAMEAEEDAA